MTSVKDSLDRLLNYCRSRDWSGYDPYDGLNSRLFQSIPVLKNLRSARLAFQQFNRRSPVNLRPLFGIRPGRNPKGLALFMTALLNLSESRPGLDFRSVINELARRLREDSLPGYGGDCWGYNFDWQSRAFFLPRRTPTVVCTSFVARSFLKDYEVSGEAESLRMAKGACRFILQDLNRVEDERTLCFSYSPRDRYFVHNATALAGSVLAQVSGRTGDPSFAAAARKSIQWVADHQLSDGSWRYGEDSVARKTGTDSFHTGFILESLDIYSSSTGDESFQEAISRGLDYYQENFFLEGGRPKYFAEKPYPFDIHSAAQAVVTLARLRGRGADRELCRSVVNWMIRKMQDPEGYFYYQEHRRYRNRIAYMRWSQAWALHALAAYLSSHGREA